MSDVDTQILITNNTGLFYGVLQDNKPYHLEYTTKDGVEKLEVVYETINIRKDITQIWPMVRTNLATGGYLSVPEWKLNKLYELEAEDDN